MPQSPPLPFTSAPSQASFGIYSRFPYNREVFLWTRISFSLSNSYVKAGEGHLYLFSLSVCVICPTSWRLNLAAGVSFCCNTMSAALFLPLCSLSPCCGTCEPLKVSSSPAHHQYSAQVSHKVLAEKCVEEVIYIQEFLGDKC